MNATTPPPELPESVLLYIATADMLKYLALTATMGMITRMLAKSGLSQNLINSILLKKKYDHNHKN